MMRHINEDPTPLAEVAPGVPARIADVVMQALARDPINRFESAESFGVAIGQAASASWGAGWLDRSGIALREPGAILSGAQSAPAVVRGGANPTSGGSYVRSSNFTLKVPTPPDSCSSDLMPLRRAPVSVPEFPSRVAWAAVLVAVVAVVLGLLGVGSSSPTPVLGPGTVTVAGHDPAVGGRVPINLNHQVSINVRSLPRERRNTRFGPTRSVARRRVGRALDDSAPCARGDRLAYDLGRKLRSLRSRWEARGSLRLSGPHGTVNDDFGVQASRSPFSTFGGIGGIVLLLFVVAYAESLLRSLRRGRRRDNRTATVVGLVVVGAIGGSTATLWGWMLGIVGPTLVSFVVAAALGAVAGLLAGLAGRQVGDRTRARRQANRLVLVARRSALPPATPSPVGVGG